MNSIHMRNQNLQVAESCRPWYFSFKAGLILVVIATAIPYCRVYCFQFLNWDDISYITDRKEIHGGLTTRGILWAFVTFQNANLHPLTWLSYMTEVHLFGLSPAAMHLTNLAFHLANTVVVALLIRRWTASVVLPLGVAVFFGIHPQHVEVVAWVSERKELLAVFFGLMTMLWWDSYRAAGHRRDWYLAHFSFLLSLMSKQMLVTLPMLLIVLEVCPLRDSEKDFRLDQLLKASWRVRWFFLLALAFTVGIFAAQRTGGAVVATANLPIVYRVANAVQSLVFYLAQTFVPVNLSPFYRHPFPNISIPETFLCGAILLAVAGFVWSRRKQPGVVAGAFWFLGTLVPVIGLVQLGSAARADRYMYFPHIGLFMMLGRIILNFQPTVARRFGYAVAGFALLLIPVTFAQANRWENSMTLWKYTGQIDPQNFRARELLALFYLSEERIDEALVEAEASVLLPQNQNAGDTHTILGCALLIHGQTERAIFHLRRGLEIEPEDYRALINLGYAIRDSDLDEARRLFAAALEYSPDNVEAMANLANCEAIQGNFARAIELMENAIKVAPGDERLVENLNHFREAQRQ